MQVTLGLRPAPGHVEELRDALIAAKQRHGDMGVEVRNYMLTQAGPNSGVVGRAASFNSWAHEAEFTEQSRANGGGPLGPLLRAGNVTIVISGASVPAA